MTKAFTAGRAATVATVAALGLGLGGLGLVVSLLYDAGVPIAVCLVAGVLLAAGAAVLSALPVEDTGELAPRSQPITQQRSPFGDLHTLQNRFAGSSGDADRFEDRVRRPLAELATERLQQRHGVDWRAQPDLARELLDPGVWALLTGPSGQFPASRAQAEAWVQAVERL